MNLNFKTLLNVFSLMLFLSCTEKVDLDIPQTKVRLVVDGVLTDSLGYNYVKLTRSIDFTGGSKYPVVNDAAVRILDEAGISQDYNYNPASESYLPNDPNFIAEVGKTYTLRIELDGKVYESNQQPLTKKAPPLLYYDVYTKDYPRYGTLLEDGEPVLYYALKDSVKDGDHYRWQFWKDDLYFGTGGWVRLNSDENLIGSADTLDNRPYFLEDEEGVFQIKIRQSLINEDVFDFWEQYSSSGGSGGPFDTPPNPPESNIRNINNEDEEVFGIFSVESFVMDSLIVNMNDYPGFNGSE